MNRTTIISIAVIIIILGGLIWFARPDANANNGAAVSTSVNGTLVVEESGTYDFGSISMKAGNVLHQFRIKNTGNESATIQKMYTSCMCTTAEFKAHGKTFGPYGMPGHGFIPSINEAILPGEEATIDIVFDPAAHGPAGVGRIQRTVTVENNAGHPIELMFSAMVIP